MTVPPHRLVSTEPAEDANLRSKSGSLFAAPAAVARAEGAEQEASRSLNDLFQSTSWKVAHAVRRVLRNKSRLAEAGRRIAHVVRQLRSKLRSPQADFRRQNRDYQRWIGRYDYRPQKDRAAYSEKIRRLPWLPKFSVVMPVYNTPQASLRAAIESVRSQLYSNWELCIADDCSPSSQTREILSHYARRDDRIKIFYRDKTGHIAEATNSAFQLATGDYVALLDHDDVLREHALAEVAFTLNEYPEAQVIFSDEDKIDAAGLRHEPFFKPDYSPDLFWAQNYLNHLTVHRADNIRQVGGWRKGFEGSQDYDLNLRVIRSIEQDSIVHIPKVLYHWRATEGSAASSRQAKGYAHDAAVRALNDHFKALGKGAHATIIKDLPYYRTIHRISEPAPFVSLIIPTKDHAGILAKCINSILERTTYIRFEIIVVDNNSSEPATAAYFEQIKLNPNVKVVRYPHPFNYSALNNFAVRTASGSILGLIDNDVEVISPSWLSEMVAHACRPEVGCVGAKLYYPNDTIQHAGIILGVGGVAGHSHKHFARTDNGYFGRLRLTHNVSAVTGACLIVRREVFDEVGGLDDNELAIAFNDVDFCLKVRKAGYLNVFTPFAKLYHHESLSRGPEDTPEKADRFASEIRTMLNRWGPILKKDPYYSPNLTLEDQSFAIRK
jgi:glycosyltransferase involved in cell wall biosynthesis